jgi:hypothetical protein
VRHPGPGQQPDLQLAARAGEGRMRDAGVHEPGERGQRRGVTVEAVRGERLAGLGHQGRHRGRYLGQREQPDALLGLAHPVGIHGLFIRLS